MEAQNQVSWRKQEEKENERVFLEFHHLSPESMLHAAFLTLPSGPRSSPPFNISEHGVIGGDLEFAEIGEDEGDDVESDSTAQMLLILLTVLTSIIVVIAGKFSNAVEAFEMNSSILDHFNNRVCNEGSNIALAEIFEVLRELCVTFKLPLAQTWVPCKPRSVLASGGGLKESCSSFDGSCMGQACISTADAAFYVVNDLMWPFRKACAELHLQKGQGVAGKSFSSHGLIFCHNVSQLSKIEYPLVDHARRFGISGSFAICLRSKHTGDDDYVLEFFLPLNLGDSTEQLRWVDFILEIMEKEFQHLMVASGRTLEEEKNHIVIIEEVSEDENLDLQAESNLPPSPLYAAEVEPFDAVPPIKNSLSQLVDPDARNAGKIVVGAVGSHNGISTSENNETKNTNKRRCSKAEKQIRLEDLQLHFGRPLVDAAKSFGVSKSTFKRICRKLNICRWPSSRKNNARCEPGFASKSISKDMNMSTPANLVGHEHNPEVLALGHGPSSAGIDASHGTCNMFTVKARYKDDLIKFNLSPTSSFTQLQEEVSKRLHLDSTSYKIKYTDDDNEPILIACDSDLQKFLRDSGLSNSKTVRLLIFDTS